MSVHVVCEHCGGQFEAEPDLAGGFTNCPECDKATRVPGLNDPLWRMWQLGMVLVAGAAGYVGYLAGGDLFGGLCFAIALGTLWLISRIF